MGNKIINLADYRKDRELGCYRATAKGICFAGVSVAFKTNGKPVIIVTDNKEDLLEYFKQITGSDWNAKFIEERAVFEFKDVKGEFVWK